MEMEHKVSLSYIQAVSMEKKTSTPYHAWPHPTVNHIQGRIFKKLKHDSITSRTVHPCTMPYFSEPLGLNVCHYI